MENSFDRPGPRPEPAEPPPVRRVISFLRPCAQRGQQQSPESVRPPEVAPPPPWLRNRPVAARFEWFAEREVCPYRREVSPEARCLQRAAQAPSAASSLFSRRGRRTPRSAEAISACRP